MAIGRGVGVGMNDYHDNYLITIGAYGMMIDNYLSSYAYIKVLS
tara:strand:+ start:1178 stop:1309 length:132 start_codon:yes stop_codon:yes gene_type:complete